MKRKTAISLLALVVSWALFPPRPVSAGDVFKSETFTAIRHGSTSNLIRSGVYVHRINWTGAGTRTTCSIKLEQSVDGSTWTDLIAATDCTTNGTATASAYVNYVRTNVTALTGSGNTVYAVYEGMGITSASSDVTSNSQYIATETSLAKLTIAQNADLGTNTGALLFGSVTTNAPTYTTAKVQPFSLTTTGLLRVTTADVLSQNITQIGGNTILAGNGATGTGSMRVTIASDNTAFSVKAQDGSGNALTSTVAGSKRAADVLLTNSAGTAIDIPADVAEDVAKSSAPAPAGIAIEAVNDDKTAMSASGDMVRPVADLVGKTITSPYAPYELIASATGNVTTTTELDIIAAVANYRICLTSIVVYNSSAADTVLNLYDNGSGGTLKGVYPAPAKGGVSLAMPTPMCMGAVNQKVTIDEGATADAIYVTLTYFKVKR